MPGLAASLSMPSLVRLVGIWCTGRAARVAGGVKGRAEWRGEW